MIYISRQKLDPLLQFSTYAVYKKQAGTTKHFLDFTRLSCSIEVAVYLLQRMREYVKELTVNISIFGKGGRGIHKTISSHEFDLSMVQKSISLINTIFVWGGGLKNLTFDPRVKQINNCINHRTMICVNYFCAFGVLHSPQQLHL